MKDKISFALFVIAVLGMVVMAINLNMHTQEAIHSQWCLEELENHYNSINQCIIDEQGKYYECFITDWKEIQTLYSKYGCMG